MTILIGNLGLSQNDFSSFVWEIIHSLMQTGFRAQIDFRIDGLSQSSQKRIPQAQVQLAINKLA